MKVRGICLKRVLKRSMSDLLPAEVLHRRKHGFGLPLDSWFSNELRSYVEARLLSGSARLRSYLEPDAVDAIVGQHLQGAARHGHSIWTLLTFEEFLRKQGW